MLLLLTACIPEYQVDESEDIVEPIPEIEDTGDVDTIPVPEAAVYGNTSGELFTLDVETGELTSVGTFYDIDGNPVDQFLDIAIDPDGVVVGGTWDAIWRIDPERAFVSKICDTTVEMMALAFSADGRLFAGGDTLITEVDLTDCSSTVLVQESPYFTSGDLVGLPDGYLYWTVEGEDYEDSDELVRVDPTYGYTSWVGPIDADRLFGLGYTDGTLYGFSADGHIVAIDPANANTTMTSADTPGWWGATTNPVVW
ncbi:MAG: SMP-30/gluconolactonase/LRE family protein [Proteobacteria bacterium]|nr:SMP-30/gluconolactonase/LRE family protein [Pseudomonadota bacterium]MCP4922163.1 SMP-30/gluconolactonase/LRE family protein [Pseudomonadota bacterium]